MSIRKSLYGILPSSVQSTLDRARYRLGLLPRINTNEGGISLSSPALLISADLELAWAWRYVKGVQNPLSCALHKSEQTRCNFPLLIKIFEEYQVPVTWAVVGHLFLENCQSEDQLAHPDIPRQPYFENEFWSYSSGDWFDGDPCDDYRESPSWYAPDLIRMILESNIKHEIACHTFSHIDCSNSKCPSEVMDAELHECALLAEKWNIHLDSFVFPGNMTGNLAILRKYGYSSYREHGRYGLDLPRWDIDSMLILPGGLQWEIPQGWSTSAWIRALKKSIDKANATNTVLSLWFHPSCDPANIEEVFPEVLEYVRNRYNGMSIMTMREFKHVLTE